MLKPVPLQADTRPKVRVRNATFTKGKSEHAGAAPGGGGGSEGGGDSPGGFGAGGGRAAVRSGPRGDDIRSTASVGSDKVYAGSGSGIRIGHMCQIVLVRKGHDMWDTNR